MSVLDLPIRTVYCHPNDVHWIKKDILSDDITLTKCSWLSPNNYIATKDITVDVKIIIAPYSNEKDFINNEITVIASHTFR